MIVTTKQCAQTPCMDTAAVVQQQDLQEMEKNAQVINCPRRVLAQRPKAEEAP